MRSFQGGRPSIYTMTDAIRKVPGFPPALQDLVEAPLYIDDTAGLHLMDMHAKLRRLKNTIAHVWTIAHMTSELRNNAARWLVSGEVPGQAGNNHPTSIPTGVFRTRDGYMNVAVSGHKLCGPSGIRRRTIAPSRCGPRHS